MHGMKKKEQHRGVDFLPLARARIVAAEEKGISILYGVTIERNLCHNNVICRGKLIIRLNRDAGTAG